MARSCPHLPAYQSGPLDLRRHAVYLPSSCPPDPATPGIRYITDLGLTADLAHRIASDLTDLGLIDAEMEMGSTWLGDID